MNFVASAVLSGIIYDLIKSGVTKLTTNMVFGNIYYSNYVEPKCQRFLDEINSKPDTMAKIEYTNSILTSENEYTTFFECALYKTNFAKRLDYALTLINDTDYFSKKLNVESLGEFLGLQSVNELKKCYMTEEEPTYEFIEMVADKLGINPAWMKAGDGNIFESRLRRLHRGIELFEEPNYADIKEFMFAMINVPYDRRIILVRKMNDFKFEYYPRPFIFYRSGGGSGASELCSVYEMLKRLNSENKMPSEVYLLNEDKFNDLLQGKIYPGSIKKEERINYILDDFISLSACRKEHFEQWYGKTFIDAQECVIEELRYERMIKNQQLS